MKTILDLVSYVMPMRKNEKREVRMATESFETFFKELETKYTVTRADVLKAVEEVGLVKGKLRTYFLVQHHQKTKGTGE